MSNKGLNSCTFIGNLGEDPILRQTQSDLAVVNFSLAVNYSVKENGQYVDRVEWIRCVVFGRQASACAEFLKKGSPCYVSGRMSTTSWESDGVKRWSTSIIVRDVIFLSQGQKSDRPPAPPQENTEDGMVAGPGDGSQAGGYDASEEDNVPF